MVRFTKIVVVQNNKEFGFDHLAVFNEFRLEILYRTLQPEKALLLEAFNSHKSYERILENRFQEPRGQLEGICLIYGTPKAAFNFVQFETIRKVFEYWGTEIELIINLDTRKSITSILCRGKVFNYEFNSRHALIPPNANVELSYNAVATRRQFSWPPRTDAD